MKMFLLVPVATALIVLGCSRETTNKTTSDLDEVGHDMERAVNKAARDVSDTVNDAID